MSDAAFEKTLTLGDAVRLSGPMAFNIMIKPAGSLCNLDCKYCYYLDKAEIYGGREPRMTEEMLEKVVYEYINANEVPEVTFNWHGGEPLVLGLDFYRKALEYERKHAGGKVVHNTIQTNGTLLNREWARFFHDNGFLVGISLDGPKDIHDRYRRDKGGLPTFDRVMSGLNILKGEGVEFNTMSTVNHACEGRGLETYLFLKEVGSGFMQFMPVVEHVKYPLNGAGKPDRKKRPFIVDPKTDGAVIAPWSVSDIGFGCFLCDIFDYWVRNDVGRCFVTNFDATLANWVGEMPGTCTFAQTCGGNSVIEHNGDLYPCDHFVYKDYLLEILHVVHVRRHVAEEHLVAGAEGVQAGLDPHAASALTGLAGVEPMLRAFAVAGEKPFAPETLYGQSVTLVDAEGGLPVRAHHPGD